MRTLGTGLAGGVIVVPVVAVVVGVLVPTRSTSLASREADSASLPMVAVDSAAALAALTAVLVAAIPENPMKPPANDSAPLIPARVFESS